MSSSSSSRFAYRRMPIEIESPEELGYDAIANNLSESSFSDMRLSDYGIDADVSELVLQYGDHLGSPALRELIAADGPPVRPDDVIVTAGAAAALFITATALLGPGEHAVIASPNYATNLETPLAIGAQVERLELRFEERWEIDVEQLEASLRPETCLVSLTYPHNPTGAMIDPHTLESIVAIVERHGSARLLVDETYRELAYGEPLPPVASLSPRAIGISSMSKTYGLPGLRIGWLACRDRELAQTLLAAKEQILICGATVDEELARRVLARREQILPAIREKVDRHLAIVRDWIADQDIFEWVEPSAGVVGFVRFRSAAEVDPDRFYDSLLAEHGTYVGPGHWFGQDRHSFRLGFAWPQTDELERGLAGLTAAAIAGRGR
jgi:aspartate/methionine/tyrosine aminotransferase